MDVRGVEEQVRLPGGIALSCSVLVDPRPPEDAAIAAFPTGSSVEPVEDEVRAFGGLPARAHRSVLPDGRHGLVVLAERDGWRALAVVVSPAQVPEATRWLAADLASPLTGRLVPADQVSPRSPMALLTWDEAGTSSVWTMSAAGPDAALSRARDPGWVHEWVAPVADVLAVVEHRRRTVGGSVTVEGTTGDEGLDARLATAIGG